MRTAAAYFTLATVVAATIAFSTVAAAAGADPDMEACAASSRRSDGSLDGVRFHSCLLERERADKAATKAALERGLAAARPTPTPTPTRPATQEEQDALLKADCEASHRRTDGTLDTYAYLDCRDKQDKVKKSEEERKAREAAATTAKREAEARAADEEDLRQRLAAESSARAAATREAQQALDKANEEARMAEEALQKKCGRDYMRIAVGMAIARVVTCAGPLELTGQVNRPGGIVSTFEGPLGLVFAMGGKVVAWQRMP